MNTYRIISVPGAPDWAAVPSLEITNVLWKPDCGIRAAGQACHDGAFLYVRLRAAEKHIRAEYSRPLSPVCRDSCLEFFFMPEGDSRYLNLEINPNACLLAGFGPGRADRVFLHRDDLGDLLALRAERTPEGWEASYRLPLSFLRLFWPGFTFTGALRANFYKCGDLTPQEHYLSWNPVASPAPDFHRPEDFGRLLFG